MHEALAPIVKTTPIKIKYRLFIRATNNADRTAPRDSPPRSAPQILPTCSAENPTFSTRAVLSTGTLTITVYPTSAMKIATPMVLHLSNSVFWGVAVVDIRLWSPMLRPRTFWTPGVAIATPRICIAISTGRRASTNSTRYAETPWHSEYSPSPKL